MFRYYTIDRDEQARTRAKLDEQHRRGQKGAEDVAVAEEGLGEASPV